MSALKEVREVVSAPQKLEEDYDTDNVSLASTVEDLDEIYFIAECIIAEERDDGRYLVKWEDYPLDQCTWEPPINLDATNLLSKWKEFKQELGQDRFQRENKRNIRAYEKAKAKAEAAKARRSAKREKKRTRLQRRNPRVILDDDSSEEERPVVPRRRSSLFVDDGEPSVLGSSVKGHTVARQAAVSRKAPLLQSSSEEDSNSDPHTSDDSLMGELRRKKKARQVANRSTAKHPQRTSILQTNPAATNASEAALDTPAVLERPVQRVKLSAVPNKLAVPGGSGDDGNLPMTMTIRDGKAIRTAPQKQTNRAINFVNQPVEQHRKAWSTENQYSKLKYRGLAEKRFRTEHAPDLDVLKFVNDQPPTLPKARPRSSDDPYGRRDVVNRRVQEEDPDDRPRSGQNTGPLADWEQHKVPLMCKAWHLSSNCPYGAKKCLFMHREYDPRGRPYKLGDISNRVPPKYQKPPITCEFWYNGDSCNKKSAEECNYAHHDTGWTEFNGRPIKREHFDPGVAVVRRVPWCNRTDEDCKYAHWNTGWVPPEGDIRGQHIRTDLNQRPRFREGGDEQRHSLVLGTASSLDPPVPFDVDHTSRNQPDQTNLQSTLQPRGPRLPEPLRPGQKLSPRDITCRFWLRAEHGCVKMEKDCKYSHRNTGWITNWLSDCKKSGNVERIDIDEEPAFRRHDVQRAPPSQNGPGSFNERGTLPSTFGQGIDPSVHIDAGVDGYTMDDPIRAVVHSPVAIQEVLSVQLPATTTSRELEAKIARLYKLDITEMFQSGVPGDTKMLGRRAMLLYHPEDHPEDIELVTRWLLMHNVQVSSLWYDGAWKQFHQDVSKGKTGIIITHPDFERFVDLPGFGEILKQGARVWSVGLQPPAGFEAAISPNPPELRHDCVCVFPHGGFVYITDDVFEQKPQLALSIVKLFFAKIEQLRRLDGPVSPWLEVDDACLLWRLCVRPEFMDSLAQECEENSAELAAENPDYLSRAELYQLLTSTQYIEQDHPIEPLSLVQDQYPILSERREIGEHPPLDYFNRLANSQEDANTHMIGYYAAMQSADMRGAYRYFYVVHTGSEAAKEWKASIHNIADVITPEQFIEELSKPSKDSLFDFLDWAMNPKEKGVEDETENEGLGHAPMEFSSP